MIQLTPIAIAATSQQYDVRVVENLCQGYCVNNTIQPQSTIKFSAGDPVVVNGTAFVTITATGSIVYQPKNSCRTATKLFSESFQVAFVGTGTPRIALTVGSQTNEADNVKCCNRAYGWAMSTNLTIAATFPA